MKYFYTIAGWVILVAAIIGAFHESADTVDYFIFAMISFMFAELEEIKRLLL